nr:hypothetical protein [Tanacetum cinerariifolium]
RFDTKSYLLKSLLNHDESIPLGIDSDNLDSEGDTLSLERLLHDDLIPLPDTLDFDFSNVVRVFLPFFTYPVTSSILLSSGSEDTIFDPGIYRFSSLEPGLSHRCGNFKKFNTHQGCNVLSEKLLDLDSTKDLHPPLHDNPLSGSTTYLLLEEFIDELPPKYDDNLQFDIESDLKEIEFLFYQDKDSSLKDSIDQKNHAHLADIFVDSIPAMFTDEHTLDYSSTTIFDVYADDFLEVEFDTGNVYDDPFDSKGEKIKESKLLIDELDLPCDFLPPFEYDSFISQDFSRVDAFPSTNNEDKIFNQGILI